MQMSQRFKSLSTAPDSLVRFRFSNVGVVPSDCNILVVKSTNHFFPAFDKIASAVM